MIDDLHTKVSQLEGVTTELASLLAIASSNLGKNEEHIVRLQTTMDSSTAAILDRLTGLQEMQSVHMARSDEKFKGQKHTLDRMMEKVDDTAERLAGNNQLTETLRNHTHTLFERIDATDKNLTLSMKTASNGGTVSSTFIDSPNFRWVMIPVIIILLGLFGLAGYNVTNDAWALIGVPSGD